MMIRILPVAAWVQKFVPAKLRRVNHWFGVEDKDGVATIFSHPDGNKNPGATGGKEYLMPLPDGLDWVRVSRIGMTTATGNDPDEIGMDCACYVGDIEAIREVKELQATIHAELGRAVERLKDLLSK